MRSGVLEVLFEWAIESEDYDALAATVFVMEASQATSIDELRQSLNDANVARAIAQGIEI